MQSKLVSIIIPAYNAEDFIFEWIRSVINQTYRNIEIIVINDGSTDRTETILKSILDPRLIVIKQANSGASNAKNRGLAIAKGSFVQFLDSDDIISSDKIEKQINAIISNPKSVAVCKTVVFTKSINSEINEIDTDIIKETSTGLNFYQNLLGAKGRLAMVQPNAYLIPISIIKEAGPWTTDFYPCPDEDGEYFSRILLCSNEVIYTGGVNYYRRDQSINSLSRTYSLIRAKNQLFSTERKCLNLLSVECDTKTKKILLLNISQVVYQFGTEYPEIISHAKNIIYKWGFKKFELLDNTKFNILSFLFGINITLKLLSIYRKIKN